MITWNKLLQFRVIYNKFYRITIQCKYFSHCIYSRIAKRKKKKKIREEKRTLLGEDKWQWLIPPCVRNKGID